MSKSWTYGQITRKLEEHIDIAATCAARAREKGDPHNMARLHRDSVVNAVHFWYQLTVGWQKDGDHERLMALAESVCPDDVDNT